METSQPNQPQAPTTPNTQSTNTPPITQTPLQSTPKSGKPRLLIFLVILLFGTTVAFAYKYYQVKQQLDNQQSTPLSSPQLIVSSPTPVSSSSSPTKENINLKEYKNEKHRFSLNYPQDMIISDSSAENVAYIETQDFNISKASHYQIQITAMNDSPLIPSEYMMNISQNTPEYDFLDKQEEMYLGGASVVMRTYKGGWSTYKKYYFYTGGLGVLLKGTGNDHTVLDQISSTFKFLD